MEAGPETVLNALSNNEFHIARDKVQGAIEVSVRELVRATGRLTYEVHATRYARNLLGVNKSKTEMSVTTYDWDLATRTASWVFKGGHGERVDIHGTIEIRADGEDSVIHDEFIVDVKVPLIGGKVEDLVIREMRKGFGKYAEVVRKHVEG